MNDNDIIKAVWCCEIKDCHECPYKGYTNCRESVMHDALDLINRQKEEIDRLKMKTDKLMLEMSYMKSPNTIGDAHEMGAW